MITTKDLIKDIKHARISKCWVVTCLPCECNKNSDECDNCGILDWWLAFDTEKECNDAYMKQHPNEFDSNGKYIGI